MQHIGDSTLTNSMYLPTYILNYMLTITSTPHSVYIWETNTWQRALYHVCIYLVFQGYTAGHINIGNKFMRFSMASFRIRCVVRIERAKELIKFKMQRLFELFAIFTCLIKCRSAMHFLNDAYTYKSNAIISNIRPRIYDGQY